MSKQSRIRRHTIPDIIKRKQQKPLVVLTAYTAPMASLLDEHVDILLVGDSLGMVLYGETSTLPVTLEDMIRHGRAVVLGSQRSCVVVDMPFGSYQESKEQAYRNCAKVMKETGCSAVKLEGGVELHETFEFLAKRGIPVMAHTGLKPQHVHTAGGYRYQGRSEDERQAIMEDAKVAQETGCFALLMECVEAGFAEEVTQAIDIPTIGIGAGGGCDGQVVVTEDMLGLFDWTARFVKRYGDIRHMIFDAVSQYAKEVSEGTFPDEEHSLRH